LRFGYDCAVESSLTPPPRRILALCTRRLGDVLLTTPLLRSLRRAWPEAEIDVLTLRWSAPALSGNPDIQRVIAVEERAGVADTLRAVGGARHYDLALSTLPADRPHFIAFWSARARAGLVPRGNGNGAWWKRRLSAWTAPVDGALHTVVQYLRLAGALGIARHHDLVPPRALQPHAALAALPRPYAVVHPAPMYRYKQWPVGHWCHLVRWLKAQGMAVVLSGGPAERERACVAAIAEATGGVTNLAGQLGFAELTGLIEGAALFVGPDTSVTHLAAATGVPTVTPFGPTDPRTWGPWPRGLGACADTPWQRASALQQRGNVWIVQGIPHCVPCKREGCERHLESRADCLDQLPAARLIAAADAALRQSTRHAVGR
jgi:heptosyltransferase III